MKNKEKLTNGFELVDYKNFMLESIRIVIIFSILFVLAGKLDGNFFLPKNGLGLFEHMTIWVFLIINMCCGQAFL